MKQQARCEESAGTKAATIDGGSECGREVANPASLVNVTIGRVVAIGSATAPLVDFPGNTSGELVPARSLVDITEGQIGREIALLFEDGDSTKPIILGIMRDLPQRSANVYEGSSLTTPVENKHDEDTAVFSAKKEIILRCGKASITLTSAGKLLIEGEHIVSRSSGVNKIRGGSVQIN